MCTQEFCNCESFSFAELELYKVISKSDVVKAVQNRGTVEESEGIIEAYLTEPEMFSLEERIENVSIYAHLPLTDAHTLIRIFDNKN